MGGVGGVGAVVGVGVVGGVGGSTRVGGVGGVGVVRRVGGVGEVVGLLLLILLHLRPPRKEWR